MRYWGPNILIDGAQVRASLDNQPLTTVANSNADADAYEIRTQNVLREISGNPAGKILLDGFTSLQHKVTIRPVNAAASRSFGAQADSNDPTAARSRTGSDSTLWYDSIHSNPVAMQARDPDHHWRADDILFHECVHAMRQIMGVWRTAPMAEWKDTEEFYAVMMTNIYLSRGGRDADMRGDYSPAFKALDPALRYGYSPTTHNREGQAFASKYNYEILSFRSDTFDVYLDISKMPLGWNPLREYEKYWDARHDYSSTLQLNQ